MIALAGTGGFGVGDGDSAGPPRPRLALRVGITGHRADALDDMAETAAMDIARALAVLHDAVSRLAERERALFADEPPLLRCISALASGSEDAALCLWDLQSGRCVATASEHTGWIWGLAFSPDGALLVSGSEDQKLKLWNPHNLQCLGTLTGHTGQIWGLIFSQCAQ
jgi:hypothetical protein